MRLTFGGADLERPAKHARCLRSNCLHICSKGALHICSEVSTFVRKTSRLARRGVVGRQCNCPTKFHAGKSSLVRLASNTINNCEVADNMAPSSQLFDGKGKMADVELFYPKSQRWSPNSANWPNHGAEIDHASMQFKIRSLDHFWSKLNKDPNASVCFDIPGGRKNRRREAADLDPEAPMRRSDAAPADRDADADADIADSCADDPPSQPARPPPKTPGEVPSGSRCHQCGARGAIRAGRGASPSAYEAPLRRRRRPLQWWRRRRLRVAARCSGPPPPPASPPVAVAEATPAAPSSKVPAACSGGWAAEPARAPPPPPSPLLAVTEAMPAAPPGEVPAAGSRGGAAPASPPPQVSPPVVVALRLRRRRRP